jgi:putative salt-induced outer membrane protein YdiY
MILSCALSSVTAKGFTPEIDKKDDEWDWVKLDSGEWLKGELRVMYEDEVEFDSDHFGVITIDWEDIEEVHTASPQKIRTNDRTSITGQLDLKEQTAILRTRTDEEIVARKDIVSIASGEPRESDYWNTKISFGANVRSGNIDQADFNAKATLQRRTALTRLYWDYTGNYSFTEESETANSHRSNGYFDYFFSSRFFVRPLSAEFFRDPYQNISHRQTYSASLGYSIIDSKDLKVDITGGPSYQIIQYQDVLAGEDSSKSSVGGIVTAVIDWEITDWMDFIGTYRAQYASDEAGGITTHSDSTIEIEVTDNIDLNFSFIWDRMQNPVSDELGTTPKKDDFRMIFGVGLDL